MSYGSIYNPTNSLYEQLQRTGSADHRGSFSLVLALNISIAAQQNRANPTLLRVGLHKPFDMVILGCVQGTLQSRLRINSVMDFIPICDQGLPRRRLLSISNFREEAKAPLKWLLVQPIRIVLLIANDSPLWRPPSWKTLPANQNCSFNCKWWPPIEAAILEGELHSE